MSLSRRSSSASIPTDSRTACNKCEPPHSDYYSESSDLNIGGGRRGVTTKAKEKVCGEVLHCEGSLLVSLVWNRSSIDLT